MFIRIKRIKGQKYGYLVKNSWSGSGARQKVAKYLGKIHQPQRSANKSLLEFAGVQDAEKYFDRKKFPEIIEDLIRLELHNHAIEDKISLQNGEIKTSTGKRAVIAANSGYLCTETVAQLASYNPEQDEGYVLASLITAAGLKIDKEHFVLLFELAKQNVLQNAPKEFYY